MMRGVALAIVYALLVLTSACTATAALRQRGPDSGTFVLRGPYMPAMQRARERMLDHCNGRFLVKEGKDSRDVSYVCVAPAPHGLVFVALGGQQP
jgi:hypothetical protein